MSARQTRPQFGIPADFNAMCDCPLHTLFPQRIADLLEPTRDDLAAACDLIGTDSYGKPHWTPETISPCNTVVQAFARHAARTLAKAGAA